VLLHLGAETEFVNVVDDLAQVVAAGDLIFDLPEYLPDLVFDGVRPAGLFLELVEVREELLIDEIEEVVAGEGFVVVELAVLALGCSPDFPAIWHIEDEGIFATIERSFIGAVLLQPIEVFEKQ